MKGISYLKLGIVFLDVVVVWLLIYAIHRGWKYRPRFMLFDKPPKKVLTLRDAILRERWATITHRFGMKSLDSMKLALIDADKMTDDVLKRLDLKGEHMADRIQNLDQAEIMSVRRLWDAHRYRNRIVHDPDFQVQESEARLALEGYQKFLEDVGVL